MYYPLFISNVTEREQYRNILLPLEATLAIPLATAQVQVHPSPATESTVLDTTQDQE